MDPCERQRFGPIDCVISESIQMCPFLRNIRDSTDFSFINAAPSLARFPSPVTGSRGPIFEDGPNFDLAFQLFHGKNGVIPLNRKPQTTSKDKEPEATTNAKFHPLASSAAAISLSSLGGSGPFGFDAFMAKRNLDLKKHETLKKKEQKQEKKPSSVNHEASSNEWLQTGNCPIAKSFRAMSGVLPLVTKALQPPKDMKLRCPTAIVMARAALARTGAVKALKPQPLPTRVLAVGMLGIALNVPLGVWREHTKKFSPSWFIAVHASVPFIAMLRKAVHMPKHVMFYTFAASILGQVIGSRAERRRIELSRQADSIAPSVTTTNNSSENLDNVDMSYNSSTMGTQSCELSVVNVETSGIQQCGKQVHSSGIFVNPRVLLQV